MMLNSISLGRRVFGYGLIVMAGVLVVPSLAVIDSHAEAGIAPAITVAADAVPTEAGVAVGTAAATASSVFSAASWDGVNLGAVAPTVFATALAAAEKAIARGDVGEPTTLTVIDFSKPSTEKRMWVYDLRTRELLFEEHVSHGRGSGKTLATLFSNTPESNQSSLGLYRTAETYIGKHGYSLRLDGLERGVNDRARARAIVMHGAAYVNAAAAKANGYLGRSLGCPALRPEITRQVIDSVKNGGLLFAYYPDTNWLSSSTYLN